MYAHGRRQMRSSSPRAEPTTDAASQCLLLAPSWAASRRRRRARPCHWPAANVYAPATVFSTTRHTWRRMAAFRVPAAHLTQRNPILVSAIHTPNAARRCHAERAATLPSRHQHLHGVAFPTACRLRCWEPRGNRSGVCPTSGISALSSSPRLVACTCPPNSNMSIRLGG
jgi:hypothetical protein